jgi:mono/diheme cytochrome c family protein
MSGPGFRETTVVLGLVLGLVAPAAGQPPGGAGQDPVAGSRVFGEKGCSRCHAVNGVGGKVGPDLGRAARPRSFFDLGTAMWNHLPRMADRMRELRMPRPLLDAREAGDLVAFLYTQSYFDPPGNAAAGQRVFTAKRCVVCHQVGGVGGVIGPSLDSIAQSGSPISVAAAMWNHGPAMAEAMRARSIERPAFADTELRDLIAYLRSTATVAPEGPVFVLPGRADVGRRLFAEKRCSDCHGVGARGGVGPDLAERGLRWSLTQFAAAIWNKAPAMQEAMKARGIAVPQLAPDEMADIVAYLYALHYFAEPGDAQRGATVARARGCLGCHTVGGGRAPVDLAQVRGLESPAAILAALWNHSFVERPAARAGAGWPELRVGEMADLMTYLQSVGRARGR